MRKALLPLSLLIILLVITGLGRLLAGRHYVLSGEAGAVLYTATFDAYADDWDQYPGRLSAQVVDGALRIENQQPEAGPYSRTKQHFGDFDLLMETRAVDGPLDNAYGVIFRLQDKDTPSPADDNYYAFLISSDGYYRVMRALDGDLQELSAWIPSPAIRQGAGSDAPSNWLRVVAQADHFRFYINGQAAAVCIPDEPDGQSTYNDITGECIGGQMLETLVDDTIASGQIGVIVRTLGLPGAVVEFDNMVVVAP